MTPFEADCTLLGAVVIAVTVFVWTVAWPYYRRQETNRQT